MSSSQKTGIKFGTDGWRGIIADDFTFDNLRLCSQATADYLLENGISSRVVIGYDTRFGSADFAAAVAEVMAGNGITAFLSSSFCPTPTVSHAAAAEKCAGIAITASHNPGNWNGFKVKSTDGSSAPEAWINKIEQNIDRISRKDVRRRQFSEAADAGLICTKDFKSAYTDQLGRLVDAEHLKQNYFKIVFDAMYGAGMDHLPGLLEGGNTALLQINASPNPAFPGIKQPEPIAGNLGKLSGIVRDTGASVGLATDGDADRLGVIDEKGNFINTLQVYSLLVLYLLEVRGERGAIVKTITSSAMLDRLGKHYGVPVYEVPVGFKYVAPVMKEHDAMVGGEESGGYGYRGHIPERDGLLSGLFFLDYMARTGKKPSQLVEELYEKVGPHYYDRADLKFAETQKEAVVRRVSAAAPASLAGIKVADRDTIDGFRFKLEDGSWLLVRFSGTEPLLRIYAEGPSPEQVERLLGEGKTMTGVRGG